MPIQQEVLDLIQRTEYYVITKDYKILEKLEYGLDITIYDKEINKTDCIRGLLRALKFQYDIDPTSDSIGVLYGLIQVSIGINFDNLPDINSNLIIYGGNTAILIGSVILATYQEIIDNDPEDADHVITVSTFNEWINNSGIGVRKYQAIINIIDELEVIHNLGTSNFDINFVDSIGQIFCDYTILDQNTIKLISNTTINNVRITIIG